MYGIFSPCILLLHELLPETQGWETAVLQFSQFQADPPRTSAELSRIPL